MIYIDPRDGSEDLPCYITPKKNVELLQLNSADAMGAGNGPEGTLLWGVEVKKLGDALQALQDGRLVQQLGRMHEDYDWNFFLLEATIRMNKQTGYLQQWAEDRKSKGGGYWRDALFGNKEKMMYQHFYSWLMSVTICAGVFLLQTTSREETGAAIMSIDSQLSKPWEDHSSMKVFDDSHPSRFVVPSITMNVVRNLADGMGWEKSAAGAAHFGTPKAAVNATIGEWMEVDGVGKVLAQRIVEGANTPHKMRVRTRNRGGK